MRTIRPSELTKGDIIYIYGETHIVESITYLNWANNEIEVKTNISYLDLNCNQDIELLWKA